MTNKPSYVKVYESLKSKITGGEIAVGDLLPPEPMLESIYKVSRTTVRKAIDVLVREGFIMVKQGHGTEVIDYKAMQNLNNVSSFSKTLLERGYEVELKSGYADYVEASLSIANKLNINAGDRVVRLQRIQKANGTPIAIITNYIREDIGTCLIEAEGKYTSMYDYIEKCHHIKFNSSNDRISAINADFAEAQMLETPVGTALILVKRICYSDTKPISVDNLKIIGSMYEFQINLLNRDV